MTYDDDKQMFLQIREQLSSSLIGDILDTLGFQQQFLPPQVRALVPERVLAGRAMPVLEADYPAVDTEPGIGPLSQKPFGLMLEALDSLRPNEVYIASGSSPRYALWGGLMTQRAMHLGAAGAILNGYSRDTHEILSTPFPVFSWGSYGQDQGPRGKVIDYRVPIEVGGVRVSPGDIVFGDIDGVVVIPKTIEKEVISQALEKSASENKVRDAIVNGMSTQEAFRTFGVM
ncbi:Regulator of RNase E activity RraA [Modicisalibacter muralis]|uniref:Putative 4-hydroxy-4-methyl-2-oxoglutarate aldolase n=1 Tax=Modicisalibacter muralis TaxID=119000 RepID=A0A1G9IMQ6_9GAMM|nr:RraA family protein [Halomonas muralis]SDL26427.1 Regulator of RNase E activity RraA [Halomonas muralis]